MYPSIMHPVQTLIICLSVLVPRKSEMCLVSRSYMQIIGMMLQSYCCLMLLCDIHMYNLLEQVTIHFLHKDVFAKLTSFHDQ